MRTYVTPSGHAVLLDDEDYDALPGRLSIGSHGYAQVTRVESGRVFLLHRYLLGLVTGDGLFGDHINGDRLDNQRVNLRVVSKAENNANRITTAARGLRGVYQRPSGRWAAKGKRDGAQFNLGTYDTPEEAAAVAQAWRIANLPGFVSR